MIVKIQRGMWESLIYEPDMLEIKRYNFNIADESERNRLHENMCGHECALSNKFFHQVDNTTHPKGDTEYLDYFLVSLWTKGECKSIVINGKIYVMENGKTSDKYESFSVVW